MNSAANPATDDRGTAAGERSTAVGTAEQLQASLREIGDLKAALDEHAIVAITDPQGKITYVNDKFLRHLQILARRTARPGPSHHQFRPSSQGIHPRPVDHHRRTARSGSGEIKNRAKDGSFYWVDTTIVPFLNETGKPRQYVAIRADITERKRAEEARARWPPS